MSENEPTVVEVTCNTCPFLREGNICRAQPPSPSFPMTRQPIIATAKQPPLIDALWAGRWPTILVPGNEWCFFHPLAGEMVEQEQKQALVDEAAAAVVNPEDTTERP